MWPTNPTGKNHAFSGSGFMAKPLTSFQPETVRMMGIQWDEECDIIGKYIGGNEWEVK
jgi:hypothetical protein